MLSKKNKINNILAVRNDRFGEFLLNIPALRALKETYPGARLTVAVAPEVKELAECISFVDKVVIWGNAFKNNLKKEKFDVCVLLNPIKEAHWLSFWAGIPIRVGYDRKLGILLNRKIKDNKALGLKHEVEYNLDLVSLVPAKTNNKSVSLDKLPVLDNEKYKGAIAVHPFTSDSVKLWPQECFKELAKRISGEFGLKVIIVGKVNAPAVSFFDGLGNNILNLSNKTTLVELAQLLRQCRLLISCDSGPMHLSAAVGTPVMALFRNDLEGKTAKRWGPWGEKHMVIESNDLKQITVEMVLNKIKGILK